LFSSSILVLRVRQLGGNRGLMAKSNGSLPPGLWLWSPAGWLPRTGISPEPPILSFRVWDCLYFLPFSTYSIGGAVGIQAVVISLIRTIWPIMYPVFHKKTRYLIAHNFGKCWPIFKPFYPRTQQWLCNELIIEDPITVHLKRVTTLPYEIQMSGNYRQSETKMSRLKINFNLIYYCFG